MKASPRKPAISESDVLAAYVANAINTLANEDHLAADQVIEHLFDYLHDARVRNALTEQKAAQYARGLALLQTLTLIISTNAQTIRATTAPVITVYTGNPGNQVYATLHRLEPVK